MSLVASSEKLAESSVSAKLVQWLTQRKVACIVVAAHLPLVAMQLRGLWSREHYQFFPFVFAAVGWLICNRWPSEEPEQSWLTLFVERALILVSLVLLGVSMVFVSPWLATASLILTTASLLMREVGRQFWPQLFSSWLLLWLILPPPLGLDVRLIQWLQSFTSRSASAILDFSGILHLMSGNVIELPGQRLLVEEACSGINSLIALIACVAFYAVWMRRSLVPAILLIASAVVWSGFVNVFRVVSITAVIDRWGIDLSTGWPHWVLGMALFGVALLLIASTDRLIFLLGTLALGLRQFLVFVLMFFFWRPKARKRRKQPAGDAAEADGEEDVPAEPVRPVPAVREWWSSWAVGGAFGCLVVLQVAAFVVPTSTRVRLDEAAASMDEAWLPAEHEGWTRAGYQSEHRHSASDLGEFSRTWVYATPWCPVSVSFDYPFVGWHELPNCYAGQGWTITQRTAPPGVDRAAGDYPYVEVEMDKPTGEYGYLLFCLFDEGGRPVSPPSSSDSILLRMLTKIRISPLLRFMRTAQTADPHTDVATYQFQTFVSSHFKLSPEQRDEVRSRFFQFGRALRDDWETTEEAQR